MRRWVAGENVRREVPEVDAFLDEIETVCRKHGMSIGHEDAHGAFVVVECSNDMIDWLKAASDRRGVSDE